MKESEVRNTPIMRLIVSINLYLLQWVIYLTSRVVLLYCNTSEMIEDLTPRNGAPNRNVQENMYRNTLYLSQYQQTSYWIYHTVYKPIIGYTTLSKNLLLDITHCLHISYWIYHIVYTSLIGYTTLSTHLLLDIPHCLHISNWIYHTVYKPLIGYTTLSSHL